MSRLCKVEEAAKVCGCYSVENTLVGQGKKDRGCKNSSLSVSDTCGRG